MSVRISGDGVTTGSIATLKNPYIFRDATVSGQLAADNQNVARVVGDGGFDYNYERGQIRASLNLSWTMLPLKLTAGLDGLQEMHELWNTVRGGIHWVTLQPSELELNSTLATTTTGTVDFLTVASGLTDALGAQTVGTWAIILTGAQAGKRFRIRRWVYGGAGAGTFYLDSSAAFTSGNTFVCGYPVRVTGPFSPRRIGNRNDFFAIDLSFEVVL